MLLISLSRIVYQNTKTNMWFYLKLKTFPNFPLQNSVEETTQSMFGYKNKEIEKRRTGFLHHTLHVFGKPNYL